jgi:hypothetical protein
MLRFPRWHRRLRWVVIAYGAAVFLWSAPEDNHIWPVVTLGTLGAALAVYAWAAGRLGGRTLLTREAVLLLAMLGAAVGLGASLVTAALMLFKNIRHSHLFPDYPLGQIGAILERAPIWSLAGALCGVGAALVWMAFADSRPHQE